MILPQKHVSQLFALRKFHISSRNFLAKSDNGQRGQVYGLIRSRRYGLQKFLQIEIWLSVLLYIWLARGGQRSCLVPHAVYISVKIFWPRHGYHNDVKLEILSFGHKFINSVPVALHLGTYFLINSTVKWPQNKRDWDGQILA